MSNEAPPAPPGCELRDMMMTYDNETCMTRPTPNRDLLVWCLRRKPGSLSWLMESLFQWCYDSMSNAKCIGRLTPEPIFRNG